MLGPPSSVAWVMQPHCDATVWGLSCNVVAACCEDRMVFAVIFLVCLGFLFLF